MSEILFHLTQILLIAASVIVMAAAVFHFYCFDRLIRFDLSDFDEAALAPASWCACWPAPALLPAKRLGSSPQQRLLARR